MASVVTITAQQIIDAKQPAIKDVEAITDKTEGYRKANQSILILISNTADTLTKIKAGETVLAVTAKFPLSEFEIKGGFLKSFSNLNISSLSKTYLDLSEIYANFYVGYRQKPKSERNEPYNLIKEINERADYCANRAIEILPTVDNYIMRTTINYSMYYDNTDGTAQKKYKQLFLNDLLVLKSLSQNSRSAKDVLQNYESQIINVDSALKDEWSSIQLKPLPIVSIVKINEEYASASMSHADRHAIARNKSGGCAII